MFHQKDKQVKPIAKKSIKPIKDLTAMATPLELLSGEKRQTLVHQIQQLSALEPQRFEQLCSTLIHQLANYCQSLPETSNSYYSLPGGIVDFALNRTETALQLFRQYIIQSDNGTLTDIQKLWVYAMCSASLLKDIGKLQIDYRVNCFDDHGQPLTLWNPLLNSLSASGHYYQFDFLLDHEDKIPLRRRLNLLLARHLMPDEGFDWIASNPDVLATWLALLSDDWRSSGTLGAILVRADAFAIQRYFNEFMIHHVSRRGGRAARISAFKDANTDANISKEQLLGIQFIQWLTASLDSGKMMINKPPLLMVPGGLLVQSEAFKQFISAFPEYKSWLAVQRGFLSLLLHRRGLNGNIMSRFEQSNNHQMHEGILLDKYAIVLPQTTKMHNIYTGKESNVSAVELILLEQHNHLFVQQHPKTLPTPPQHLTASGEWKVLPIGTALKPGFIRGG